MTHVKFSCSKREALIIAKIAARGTAMAKKFGRKDLAKDPASQVMDITAVHCNGNPLRVQEFLDADDFNFGHDFFGIVNNIDRSTGKLSGNFLPRFSRRETE